MTKFTAITIAGIIMTSALSAQNKNVNEAEPVISDGITGTVLRHIDFKPKQLDARNVDVWLPPGYDPKSPEKYPVLYMHDGQNVFDPKTSFIGVDWGVDEAMTKLIADGKIKPAIVVAVWNAGMKRMIEYMPQKAFEKIKYQNVLTELLGRMKEKPESDNYLKFLVSELKPFIDSTYKTLSNTENTFIMGSSMGGLISAYAVCEYPAVFSGAGCISTHWPAGDGIMIDYMKENLPDPASHKLYFDFGTQTLDALYEPYQKRMDEVMSNANWTENKNWITRKFEGEEHSERAWKKRIDIPLLFLLGK